MSRMCGRSLQKGKLVRNCGIGPIGPERYTEQLFLIVAQLRNTA